MHHDTRTKLKSIDLIHIWCYRFKDCGREGVGQFLWEKVNKVFDYMPLAAVIDSSIFCVHGGIPRPRAGFGMHQMLTAVQKIPVPLGICKLNRSGAPFSALCMLINILYCYCWLQHHATKMNKIPMATILPWTWSGETLRAVHRCVYWDWGSSWCTDCFTRIRNTHRRNMHWTSTGSLWVGAVEMLPTSEAKPSMIFWASVWLYMECFPTPHTALPIIGDSLSTNTEERKIT